MNPIFIAALIGLVAGPIDVIPMILQKLDRRSCVSAFLQYFALGLIIPFVSWDLHPCVKGLIIAELMAIPVMILVFPSDRKAVIPMTIFAAILGAGIGISGAYFIG